MSRCFVYHGHVRLPDNARSCARRVSSLLFFPRTVRMSCGQRVSCSIIILFSVETRDYYVPVRWLLCGYTTSKIEQRVVFVCLYLLDVLLSGRDQVEFLEFYIQRTNSSTPWRLKFRDSDLEVQWERVRSLYSWGWSSGVRGWSPFRQGTQPYSH